MWDCVRVVREQQKLAGEKGVESSEMSLKDRQQVLYGVVCEPVIRRGQLLLQLRSIPAVTSTFSLSPFKLLPGISVTPSYGKFVADLVFLIFTHMKCCC